MADLEKGKRYVLTYEGHVAFQELRGLLEEPENTEEWGEKVKELSLKTKAEFREFKYG